MKCFLVNICILSFSGLSGSGPLCLSCNKVVRPRDCAHVTVCGEHEVGLTFVVVVSFLLFLFFVCLFVFFFSQLTKITSRVEQKLSREKDLSVLQWVFFTISKLFHYFLWIWVMDMVFNATFNNISVISWRPVLLVEKTGVPGENHRPSVNHW